MAAATAAPPAAATSEFPVLFLARYGDVPPGYAGIIILPRPAAPVNTSAVSSSAVNAAAEVLLQQPPDFGAALRRAPPPLSIPCRMVAENLEPGELSPKNLDSGILIPENLDPGELSPDNLDPGNLRPDNLDPGELSPENLDPGDRRTISATKGSTHPDLRGKRRILASKRSNNSDLGTKGSTSISTDREGSSRKGSIYSDWENRKIKEFYQKSRADKSLKKVDWQHLCDTVLTGRTVKGVEGQFYRITNHDDLRSVRRAARKVKDLPPKSGGSEGTEGQDTAKKTVQDPPLRNGVHTSEKETAKKTVQDPPLRNGVHTSEKETAKKTVQDPPLGNGVHTSEKETARNGVQNPPPRNEAVEDAPSENKNGPVQDPSSSCNGTAEGTVVDKTFKEVQSGGEADCQEG